MNAFSGRSVLGDPFIARQLDRAIATHRYLRPRDFRYPFRHNRRGVAAPPVPHFHPERLPFSSAKGASGGTIYEVVRNTSAATAAPTQQNEFLVGIVLEGGATVGAWEFTFDGVHTAIFPSGASGLDATGAIGPEADVFYPLNYGPIGTNIPAGQQTYGGGLAAVKFIFSNRPNPLGYRISQFTGVFVTGNESGTGGTAKTYTIPGALGKPTAIVALAAIEAGTATGIPIGEIQFPAIGNYAAWTVPAELQRGREKTGYSLWPIPDYDPAASFSLTHLCRSLGGATDLQIAGTLFYTQGVQPVAAA